MGDAKIHNFSVSLHFLLSAEAYSEPCQTSKMKLCAKKVNSLQPFTIFAKNSIFDVWKCSEYASDAIVPWFFPDISQTNAVFMISFNRLTSCTENQSVEIRTYNDERLIINKRLSWKISGTSITSQKKTTPTFLLLSALPLMQLLIICKHGKVTASRTSGFLYCKDSRNKRTTGK